MALWKRNRQGWSDDYQSWQSIDGTPIPLSIVLKRREPGKYRHWMMRIDRSNLPPAAAA